MAKWLITLGIVFLVLGLAWPLLSKLGLGQLPGDIRIEREGITDQILRGARLSRNADDG